ncbi:MAG: polyribonucleotide nucleotidyltransferase [Candidatus Aureabacteria bacterium]|nr:polyribonucleotide nucleotidyltransferase [Candidatus Auribacterota bacterium]
MKIFNVSEDFYGEKLSIETGKLAKQADGAVTVRYGDTIILSTVVSAKTVMEDQDFFPLTVDYRERTTAAGKFKGGYLKRENKPTQKEILVSRLTDRPLRPLFDDGFLYDTILNLIVISADKKNDPDALAILSASAALCVSNIPFHSPVGGVRVGRIKEKFIINPTNDERQKTDIDLIIAGNKNGILMVEGHSNMISEKDLLAAIDFGYAAVKKQVEIQEKLIALVNPAKENRPLFPLDKNLIQEIRETYGKDLREALYIKEKQARNKAIEEKAKCIQEKMQEKYPDKNPKSIVSAINESEREILRQTILNEGVRADGRGLKNIRDIWIETGLLPRTHGSAIFTRGETQALAVVTLGGAKDAQRTEDFGSDVEEPFYLHYTFQGYSVGECKPYRGPGRREIGHGVLAERALKAVIPDKKSFAYTIRVTSDILESNGSSSMATVCSGSLALMDAGVPVSAAVSGIAMGLIKEGDKVAILSDILGLEDALGDMDFKVAGTRDGITAFQMDIKVEGISHEIMQQALNQANQGRMHILDIMDQNLSAPKELSKNAPRIYNISIPQDKIGLVIGPGGKNIRGLTERYNVSIDINDEGTVSIQSEEVSNADACRQEIELMTSEIEAGKIYKGKVVSITNFGAFIECLPGKEALLHISRISHKRINKVSDVLSVGQTIEVKCIEIDEKGRAALSRKELEEENQS